jgi:uncharacterized protein YciI
VEGHEAGSTIGDPPSNTRLFIQLLCGGRRSIHLARNIMWGISSLLGRSSALGFLAVSTPKFYSTSTSMSATQYLLKYDYIPDVLEKRGPYREGHLSLAKKLIAEGSCLSGGPTGDVGMTVPSGALFIFTTSDAAKLFVEQDPYVSAGIVTGHSIVEWNVVVQKE